MLSKFPLPGSLSITLASHNSFPVPISFKHLDADLFFILIH